jgi:hypothetical protein
MTNTEPKMMMNLKLQIWNFYSTHLTCSYKVHQMCIINKSVHSFVSVSIQWKCKKTSSNCRLESFVAILCLFEEITKINKLVHLAYFEERIESHDLKFDYKSSLFQCWWLFADKTQSRIAQKNIIIIWKQKRKETLK